MAAKPRSERSPIDTGQAVSYGVLLIGAMTSLLPFVFMVLSGFKDSSELQRIPPTLLPEQWTLDNFIWAWDTLRFPRLFANSILITTLITLSVIYTSGLLGYVLEKIEFPGRRILFFAIISTMFVPHQIAMVVLWDFFNSLKLLNSHIALILPFLYSGFGIFLMKQAMHTIPGELLDAARIDGASEIGIFHRIVIPNMWPSLAALAIFTFMFNYDSFFWPLIVLQDYDLYTVPLGLAFFQGQYFNDLGRALAGTTLALIPTLLVFLVLQRRIIQGFTLSGMKG
ncbi:MAG: carbohydrate ABC transporter permease [Chloroflexi bacterium]|nr:carbohydrate ABC transporter permease [Chloroflexota bacterium]